MNNNTDISMEESSPPSHRDSSETPSLQAAEAAAPSTSTHNMRAAAAALWSEDEQLQHFLHLLASSSNSSKDELATSGTSTLKPSLPTEEYTRRLPTVPTALSRRILHKQGVGYLDTAVASIASAAADRFLATVLHQAIICRDRRIQGEDIILRNRKHFTQLQTFKQKEREDKKRKFQKLDQFLDALQNLPQDGTVSKVHAPLESLQHGTKEVSPTFTNQNTSPTATVKSGKKRNNAATTSITESSAPPPPTTAGTMKGYIPMSLDQIQKSLEEAEVLLNEVGNDHDSMDKDEAYYNRFYGTDDRLASENLKKGYTKTDNDREDQDYNDNSDNDEDQEIDVDPSRFTLQLKDLARPLEAWGVNLIGKLGLGSFSMTSLSLPTEEEDIIAQDDEHNTLVDQEMQDNELQSSDFPSPFDEKKGDAVAAVKKKRPPTARKGPSKPNAAGVVSQVSKSSTKDKESSSDISPGA